MDLSILQALIPDLAGYLHIEPATLLLYLTLLVTVCNLVGRLIPDDAAGALGVVRKLCKFLGILVPNRITAGVTVNDVVREVVGKRVDEAAGAAVVDLAGEADALIPEVIKDPFGEFASKADSNK